MADSISGNINFAGLGSGTDFKAMIEGMVKVERMHINRLENWRGSWSGKIDKFQELNTSLLSLQTTLKSMDTLDEFMTRAVSTSDPDTLTATATSAALVTTHAIEINQLAQNDIHVTASGASSIKDPIFTSTGSFTFSYQGESVTLSNIAAGTTMEGFVNMINAHADSRSKIRATTINDGTSTHLQIYGLDLGADNQVIISNTTGMIFNAGDFGQTQEAQNSKIKVDGFPPGGGDWIERDTNSINDVIDGVTINLKKTTDPGATINVGITTDAAGMVENVQKFVDQVNTVRTLIKDLTKVDTSSEKAQGSLLTGNYGVELLIGQRLKDIISSKGVGFSWYEQLPSGDFTGDKYSALSQLGIMTNAESGGDKMGLLEIDSEKLNAALLDDPYAVAELFAANNKGESDSPNVEYLSHITGVTDPGDYNVQYEISGGQLISATINGNTALVDPATWQITGDGGHPEAGLAIRVENHNDGTYGNASSKADDAILVHIKLGKAGEMSGAITDITGEEGPLSILEKNYKSIISSIDKKIEYEENRIELYEKNLTNKYARLDALLGKYQGMQAQLTSSIKQLGTGS
ncbi:flagellar hook-associated protein 2 [Maridesulfovibrio ferrireducens]|uniref:Flagellar hook-associated protein 2 n=1 Tax=Maridesulfovibrio ferrireducens TaxID=246191 RepID=A0A1G9F311_9BACT|nr:flagellar filament capping protein FliD [Maridesulfovibrio ferrireducens]SDK82747.1 flagellar hook-associated protein 2 [Maridesulfovibrio ferrireducens]